MTLIDGAALIAELDAELQKVASEMLQGAEPGRYIELVERGKVLMEMAETVKTAIQNMRQATGE